MRRLGIGLLVTLVVSAAACGGKEGTTEPASCSYEGKTYPNGASFPSTDGCNTCSCDQGLVACTTRACQLSCMEITSEYAAASEAAKACDPAVANSCTKQVVEGLACGCETFVNPANAPAIEQMASLQQAYTAGDCQQGIVCGPCLAPLSAHCSAEGRCEDDNDEAACKVGGVVYPSGATDIDDPFSCNKCSCSAGELACTEIGCVVPCPEGTAPGKSCAECGPTDACTVVEHACLSVCTDRCSDGLSCVEGLCRNVCG